MSGKTFFVSGIDTDAGKSYCTGYIARKWCSEGFMTITQKFIQTGNSGCSEDIELHRRIMGIPMQEADLKKLTMPEIFSYPCSPHLASEIDRRPINFAHIEECTSILEEMYDRVLLEGAGGLMVPLTRSLLTIDYVAARKFPLIFVTSGKLGSLNHTLLSLEAIRSRGMELYAMAYNHFPESGDSIISDDTIGFLKDYLKEHFPDAMWIDVPVLK